MNQKQRILDHLRAGHSLTRLDSWQNLGILECPARISELRQDGHPIRTRRRTVISRYGERVSIAEWSYEHE